MMGSQIILFAQEIIVSRPKPHEDKKRGREASFEKTWRKNVNLKMAQAQIDL